MAHPGAHRFLFHYLLPLPYSVLVLVSGKSFLPGGKESHQPLQAYTDLYQAILEKKKIRLSISRKLYQIPKGLLRVLLGSLAAGEA